MKTDYQFYLCPTCFEAAQFKLEGHRHPMIRIDPGRPGDEQRKPKLDAAGRLASHAPVWFLEATAHSLTKQ